MKDRAELLKYTKRTQAMYISALLADRSRESGCVIMGLGDAYYELCLLSRFLEDNLEKEKRILGNSQNW